MSPEELSAKMRALGKIGGPRTLELYGPEHFSKAGKASQLKREKARARRARIVSRAADAMRSTAPPAVPPVDVPYEPPAPLSAVATLDAIIAELNGEA